MASSSRPGAPNTSPSSDTPGAASTPPRFHVNPRTKVYTALVRARGCMGRTPQRHCPRCDKRRMLIAVEKIRGEDLFRCLCRECAEDEGHMWEDSSKEEASWPPEEVEDEHDARETS